MTHVVAIELENYGRYRGAHRLALAPGVYAVVASARENQGRSNWLGKSTLMNAVAHALYGWHDFDSEDGWISHGEKQGRLAVETSDGWTYRRERARGKSTQFHLDGPGGKLSGDAAQAEAERIVGLAEADFFHACFFRQKQMSRIVTMQPADRLRVVSGWLGLERVERCASNAVARLGAALEAHGRHRAEEERLAAFVGEDTLVGLGERARRAAEAVEAAKARGGDEQRRKNALEFKRLDGVGRAARAELDALPGAEDEKAAEAAHRALSQAATIANLRARFDGVCPVALCECPAKERIKLDRGEAEREQLRAAEAEAEARRLRQQESKRAALKERIAGLKARALPLVADHRWAEANPEGKSSLPALAEAVAERVRAEARLEAVTQALADLAVARMKRERAAKEVELARAAVKAYRGGARLVAERWLGEIAAGANALLADAGIDLGVRMSWAREGDGLATQCGECGWPLPKSQRVKACERCGAARGPKLVEKLLVELSDRSGAAEDLGGIAVALGASAWLRRRRGTAWGAVFLDEAMGALDQANRKAFGVYLAGMLRGRQGFEQAFVVAHSRDATDAMPGRIEVVSEGKWSRFA